jgi:hypothetical protein
LNSRNRKKNLEFERRKKVELNENGLKKFELFIV